MNGPDRCARLARFVRRAQWPIALAWLLACARPAAAQSLIEGVDGWSAAVTARPQGKWVGQRVPFPAATPRPASLGALDAPLAPVRVHAADARAVARLGEVVRHAEQIAALLGGSGLFALHGDGGQGGSFQRDLYVGNFVRSGALVDDAVRLAELDSVRSFAVLDLRVPGEQLATCTGQALIEAELLELDPAESASVRAASAAYFSTLLFGESCDQPAATRDTLHDTALLRDWLEALAARMDQNQGRFLFDMLSFARQQTWDGSGLRGSPDLLEVIAKLLELKHEKLEEVAGILANEGLLARSAPALPDVPRVAWSALPAHRPAVTPALLPLDSDWLLVDLEQPRAGRRLHVWSRGEPGVRWVLSATRLDANGRSLGTVNAPVRKEPDAELQLELEGAERYVLVSISNLAGGLPDPDLPGEPWAHSARLIVDYAR